MKGNEPKWNVNPTQTNWSKVNWNVLKLSEWIIRPIELKWNELNWNDALLTTRRNLIKWNELNHRERKKSKRNGNELTKREWTEMNSTALNQTELNWSNSKGNGHNWIFAFHNLTESKLLKIKSSMNCTEMSWIAVKYTELNWS